MGVANRRSHWTVNRIKRRSHQQPHSVALVRAGGVTGIKRRPGDRTRHGWTMYLVGCPGHRSSYVANTGFTALEAMGAANLMTLAVKVATNRQYAYHTSPHGEFWEGGRSFPSGHAAASFAFASVIAHRYPHKFWLKWGAYGLATGVSLARVGGKKHFASDILVGGALGYVTGTYLATR